ncbi:hypothetical protein BDB01DRAFT_852944 [Pilobolus umbonatus]|nr:hypothetical protein BDB01DRAFT_852944 [Pilobolus umbonatus]
MNEEYDQLTEFIHILPDEEPLPLTASDLVFNHLQLTLKMQCELVALEENPIVFDYSEYQPIYTTQLDLPLYQTTLPQCCIQKTDEHNLCGSSLLPPTWNISFDDYHQVFNTGLFLENNDILKLPFYEESMKEEPVPSCLSVSSMSDYSEDEEDPLDPLLSYPYFAFYSTNSVSQFEERESDVGMNVIKKGRNVEKACNHCKRSHLKCDKVRPCSRCVASGKIGCEDVDHKPRGRPRLQKKQDELMLS